MAQQRYNVGDYVEKDGIPCVVAYVDSTRMHGLLLSVRAIVVGEEKTKVGWHTWDTDTFIKIEHESADKMLNTQYDKKRKYYTKNGTDQDLSRIDSVYALRKQILPLFINMPKVVNTKASSKIKSGEYKKILNELLTTNSGDGAKNTANVINYCTINGLSLQDYFPAYYWTTQLGEGWFIPGNDELELMVRSFGIYEGVGKDYPIKASKENLIKTFCNEVNKNVVYDVDIYAFLVDDYFFPILTGITSSTMVKSEWRNIDGNKKKISTVRTPEMGGVWLALAIKSTFYGLYWCNVAKGCMMTFSKNHWNNFYCAMIRF